MQLKVQVCTL